ncbi:MAG: glycosyltransferase family 4 protein [Thermodesulfobacteriota bacterium]|nr:glycosyltransferase family 4 protein [Thermodesulfobacteriota bacterium]
MSVYKKIRPVPLKILYFGIYSKGIEYPRNNNLIRGLRLNGVDVVEAHFELAGSFQRRMGIVKNPLEFVHFFLGLIASFIALTWKFMRSPRVDAVIVGHPGYFHIHLAWFLRFLFQRRVVLVYDVFIPLYEMLIEDRGLLKSDSLFARLFHRFERSCCRYADLCLTDTEEHCQYIVEEYGLSPERVSKIFVGSTIDQNFDSPRVVSHEIFRILFVGTYIPLHGIDIILKAIRYLAGDPDMRFSLVGSGQLRERMESLARKWKISNVMFQDWIPTEHLGAFIRSFDLSMGIFGITPKTARVIPSKIYDICAAGVPFITADTPAVREVFKHGENAYLIPAGNPEALAEAIRYLKTNRNLRDKIAEGARQTGEGIFSLKEIGNDLINAVYKIM